jgi:hypothetical protein
MERKVGLKKVAESLYMIDSNSSLIDSIAFSYSIHTLLIESEIYENNEWYDFASGIHFKIIDYFDDTIVFSQKELELIKMWLDWVCRIVIESEGKHHSNKEVKYFLSSCDNFFSCMKNIEKKYIVEKIKKDFK